LRKGERELTNTDLLVDWRDAKEEEASLKKKAVKSVGRPKKGLKGAEKGLEGKERGIGANRHKRKGRPTFPKGKQQLQRGSLPKKEGRTIGREKA